MSIQPPHTFRRSLSTKTIKLKARPARLLVLLGLMTLAVTALAATVSSTSVRQFIFGAAASSSRRQTAQPKAALADPLLTAAATTSGSSTMTVERSGHTATRLSDGRVLISGGENTNGTLNQCEIYDPATGNFTVAGNMNSARADQTATLLSDGRVLVAGGRNASGAVNTTEIFDPGTGAFTSGPNMSVARAGHSATLFANGSVFIAGGDADGSAEIFDPSTGSSAVGAHMNVARSMHSSAQLADGRVLLVGGRTAAGDALSSGEIFDPANSSFADAGLMTDAHVRATLRVLPDGKVQIIGGTGDHEDMEIYDPAINAFGAHAHVYPTGDSHPELVQQILDCPTRAAMFRLGSSSTLLNRIGQTITELPGQALVTGGVDSTGAFLNSAATFNSSNATVTTDKLDYPPGTPVIISGTGWQPNEAVTLMLHEDPHVDTENPHTFTVQADPNGNFTDQPYAPEDLDVGVSYILAATGGSSGRSAQTSFHDNKSFTITFAGTGGGSITFSGVASTPAPSPNPCTGTCDQSLDNNATGTLTVTPNAGSVFAGWSGTFVSGGTTTCTGTTSPCNFSLNGSAQTLTATFNAVAAPTTTGISPTSKNYGDPGFTMTVNGTNFVSGSTVQFNGASRTTTFGSGTQLTATIVAGDLLTVGSFPITVLNPGGTTSNAQTFTVNKATVTASVTASNKTYDSNTTATITGCTLSGVLAADTANVTCSAAGPNTFADKNVGTSKTVTATNISLSGSASGKYQLSSTSATTTANITARALTVTAATNTKTYDGTTSAAATPTITSGALQGADTATFTETYNNKNAGSGKTLTPAGSVTDGNSGNNYAITFVGNTTGVINARALTVTAATNTKTYDGTTSAAATPAITSGTLQGTDTANFTEAYANKNAGTGKTLTPSGTVTDGNSGNNYAYTFVNNTTGVINAKAITVTAVTDTKTYDGTASSSGTPTIAPALVGGDTSGFTQAFANKNVGTSKTITPSGSANDGNSGNNYAVTFANNTTGVINAKAITVTAVTDTKTYDGTASSSGTPTIAPALVGGDTSGFTQAFANKNVGTSKTITPSGSANDGNSGNNYAVTFANNTTGVINAKAITVTAVTDTKTYDGTTSSSGTPTIAPALVGGDTSGFTQAFANKNVGTGKTLTPSGSANDGNSGNNYAVTFANNTTGVINAKAITVTAVTDTKTYDGTASSSGTPTIAPALVGGDTSGFTQAFANKNVGTSKTITPSGSANDGNSGNNYAVTFANNTTGVINAKAITVTAATDSKTYDGTTTSSATPTVTSGTLVGGDTSSFTQAFDTKNVGTNKTLTPSGSVSDGNSGNNYNVTFAGVSTGTISARAITVTAATDSKTYDGTTTSSATPTVTTGSLVGGDTASFTQAFDTKNVSTNKTLTPSGSVSDGNSGNNYNVTFANNTTGVINAVSLTITAVTNTKSYDGNTSAAATPNVSGLQGSDTVTGLTETYDNHNAGTSKTLSVATYTVNDGNSGGNYTVSTVTNTTGVINKAALTITAATKTKTYDGNTSAAATPGVSGLQGSDTVTGLTETYDNANAGTSKTLSVATYTVNDGNSGNNYTVTTATDTTGVINKANATINVTPYSVTFDGNAHTATGTATGVGGADLSASLNLTGTTHTNAGTYNGDAWSFSGGTNYNDANGTVDDSIAKADASVLVNGYSGTYDAAAHGASLGHATGVGGANLSSGINLGATFTNVPGGTAHWTFSYANYNDQNGDAAIEIAKAAATATAGSGSNTFDATTHSPSACVVSGAFTGDLACTNSPASVGPDVSTTPISPSVTGSVGNFEITPVNGSYTISKASASITVNGYTGIYDGAAHGATGSATGVGGVDLSGSLSFGSAFTNVPGGMAHWTFAGGTNYNDDAGDVAIVINPAAVTATAGSGASVFDGATHSPTACVVSGAFTGDLACTNSPASAGPDVSVTPISPNVTGSVGNFSITPVNGSYTISKYAFSVCDGAGHCTGGSNPNEDNIGGRLTIAGSVAFGGSATATVNLSPASLTSTDSLTSPGLDPNPPNNPLPTQFKVWIAPVGDPTHPVLFGTGLATKTNSDHTWTTSITQSLATSLVPGDYIAYVYGDDGSALTSTAVADDAGYVAPVTASFAYPTLTAPLTITKATATVTATGGTFTYDGSAHAGSGTATGVGGSGDVLSPAVTLTYDTIDTLAPVNAGTYHVTAHFAGNSNYSSADSTPATITINAKDTTASVTASDKPYDGNNTATIATCTVDGKVGSDDVTCSAGGPNTFADKNVGTNKTVTATGITLGGAKAGNYNLTPTTATTTASINAVTLTASIIGNPTKPYDGNTNATLTSANFSITGLIGSESFTVNKTTGSYNSKDVPSATTVTTSLAAGDFTPGADTLASNYNLPATASGAGQITAVTLTASITGNPTKPYDGNTNATLTSANFSIGGLIGSESFTVSKTTGSYNNANVASATTVTTSLVAGDFAPGAGTLAGNYNLPTTASGAGQITAVTLTASIIGNPTKTYDGNANATLTSANFSISGLIGTESFTVDKTTGTYNSANVASATTVTTSLVAGDFTPGAGTLASNYTLPTTASGAGHILAAHPTLTTSGGTFTYDGNPHASTGTAKGVDGTTDVTGSFAYTYTPPGDGTAPTNASATPYQVSAAFTSSDSNYDNGTPATNSITINKASSTTTINCPANVTYNGSALTPCSATATGAGNLSVSVTVVYGNNTNAGTATADATYTGDANHDGSSATQATFTIDKASSSTTIICPSNVTYDGSALTPCSATATGAGSLSVSVTVVYGNNTNAGTATADATYTGDANHNGSVATQATFTIDKASSSTTISCPTNVTYDGSALTPCSATATGAGSLNASVTVVYGNNTNAGTATADATYTGDANHNGSVATQKTFAIDKASSSTTITCPTSVTYTGSALEPCTATATGAGSLSVSVTVVYGNNTNVGTATADATYTGDANHNGSVATQKTFAIDKASSSTTINCPTSVTYTGSALEPCTATATGAGGLSVSVTVVYGNNTNAGTATADATYTGDPNHNGSSATQATFIIDKANTTTVVSCPVSETYTGSAITPCSVTVTGANLSQTPTPDYSNNINVGTATASYTYVPDGNHNGSSDSKNFAITKADTTTVVSCPASETYTGSAITPCTVAVTGANLSLAPTPDYLNNINVGTATASYTYVPDGNHNGSSDSKNFAITKADTTTVVSCPVSETYTGSAITPCSVTVTGANLSLTPAPSYSNNINVGTATASYTYVPDGNHNGSSDSKNFAITPAASTTTIDCSPGSFTYTGSAITPCTATVTRVGDANTTTTVTYANNVNVGTATANASYAGDSNHTGSTAPQVTFAITQAGSTTTIDCSPGSFTYTGSALTPCTATVARVGDANTTMTVTYANNVNVGTATANATYAGDANHTGSTAAQVTFAITQAGSTTSIDCSPGSFTYTGSAITPCTATVTRVGDANTTATVVYANNTNVGTATANASYAGDPNHTGSTAAQVTFAITPAGSTTTIDCSPGSFTYTGSAITPCTATVTRVGDANTTTTVTYANNVNVGTATADASYSGDANHTSSIATQVTFAITPAASTTTIDCSPGSFTYTGSALTPCTATVTRVGDTNTTATVTYANNTNVGTATADATYTGDANHSGSTATQKTFTINQASSTTTITCPTNVTYTGSALAPCTAAATGAGISPVDRTAAIAYGNNITAGTATADASWTGDANHSGSTATQKTFTIDKANQTITWSNPAAITYGTALSGTQLNATVAGVSGGSAPGALTYSPVTGAVPNAGTGQTLAVDAAATSNYNAAHKTVTIDVIKKSLTITADNKSMPFGGSVPAFTASYTGLVAGDTAASLTGSLLFTVKDYPGLTTPVTVSASTFAGTYAIVPSGPTSGNYNITFANGTLTIGGWTLNGFYQPVDMIPVGVLNTVKGGSTVPMKFNIFAGGVERKSVADILNFQFQEFTCGATGTFESPIEVTTTGGTSLRYDTTGGQFIENWQTPKTANKCYQVRMTALDGTHLDAFFKTK
jgi:Uri superfamily endonuclease